MRSKSLLPANFLEECLQSCAQAVAFDPAPIRASLTTRYIFVRQLAASGQRGLTLWEIPEGRLVATLPASTGILYPIGLGFSRDGKMLAYDRGSGRTVLWNIPQHTVVTEFTNHTMTIIEIDFSPDGRRVALASWDRTANVWDLFTLQLETTLQGFIGRTDGLSFSMDGTRLAAAGLRGLRVFDTTTWRETQPALRSRLAFPQYTADGKYLVAAEIHWIEDNLVVMPALDSSNRSK